MQDLRDMQLIGDDLQQFQQNIQLLRKMSDQFCEQPTPAAQAQVRAQLDVVNQLQRRINARLESAGRDIDSMPRPQQARPRATHAKLRKDFERVSATLGPIVAKVEMATERMLNATQQRSAQGAPLPGSSAARRGMGQSAAHDRFQGGESGGFGDLRGDAYDAEPTQPSSVQLRMQQDGAEIEEAILRGREEVRAETTAAQRRAAALCRSPNADV